MRALARVVVANLVVGALAAGAAAEDVLSVSERTFDRLGKVLAPIPYASAPHPFRIPYPSCSLRRRSCQVGWLTICTGRVTAEVNAIDFDLKPSPARARVTARAEDFAWCGVPLPSVAGTVSTQADVRYVAAQRSLLVEVDATSFQPELEWDLTAFGLGKPSLPVPLVIDVGDPMTLDPIPIDRAAFRFQSARGTETLGVVGEDVTLKQFEDRIELRGSLRVR